MCFFPIFKKYSGLWSFSVFPRCQCVYTHQAGRKPGLQQNWQSSEKSQNLMQKTQYLMNTLYMYIWRYIKTRCIHHSYFFNFAMMRWLYSSLSVLPWVCLSSDMTELNTNQPHNNYILKFNKRNKLSSNYVVLFLSLFVPLSVITVENLSLLWALAKELARIIKLKNSLTLRYGRELCVSYGNIKYWWPI